MSPSRRLTVSGSLFLAGGIAWMSAASLAHQSAWYGVGVAFIAIGASFLARARRLGR